MKESYYQRYTWRNRLGKKCLAHDDGAVSLMIGSSGLSIDMLTDAQRQAAWLSMYRLLNQVDSRLYLECHYFREPDSALCDNYLARNQEMTRCHTLGGEVREAMAEHLRPFARNNRVYFVLVWPETNKWWRKAKNNLVAQAKRGQELEALAKKLLNDIPEGEILLNEDYIQRIFQGYHRDRYYLSQSLPTDNRFPLNEQIANVKPALEDGLIKVGRTYTKVALMTLYPDAKAGWFLAHAANYLCDVHVSHVIQPIDTRKAMATTLRESKLQAGLSTDQGVEVSNTKLSDLAGFREFVAQNKLNVFRNCFIVHLHSTKIELVLEAWLDLERAINDIGQVISDDDISMAYFRFGQCGQGYQSGFMRADHEWQVGNMLPAVVFDEGVKSPSMLRLANNAALVGFDYPDDAPNHSITFAKTGAGKDVEKIAQILETMPLGTDWYITEIGASYQWCVEGLGGTYTEVDPDKTVINPFPAYDSANLDNELPLDAKLVAPTIKALAFILLGGERHKMTTHELNAAQNAMQYMYIADDDEPRKGAPNFVNYLEALREIGPELLPEPAISAALMADNLDSFLGTVEGRIFTRDDNFILTPGITGVNLEPLMANGNDELMVFYLVFICLRYSQYCFTSDTPSRVLVNEIHEAARVAPEVISTLVKQITRMGRKTAGAFDGVSQDLSDFELDKGVINQLQHMNLLYTPDDHDVVADRLTRIPKKAIDVWRRYPDPIAGKLPYRQGLHCVGDSAWDLHLTFPDLVLDIADTSSKSLVLKRKISLKTNDLFERLALFREAKASMKQNNLDKKRVLNEEMAH